MTTYTTRTRDLGEVTFYAPAATDAYDGYVWIESSGHRRQICEGGGALGVTVTSTAPNLKVTAQRWLRQRRDWMRREERG